jgi:predicted PurR-regulated permease PerM
MNFGKWKKKKWFAYTVATCSAVVLYMLLSHVGNMFAALGAFFSFLRPIITGIIIAYVINPLANFFDRKVFHKLKGEKTRWTLSSICALIVLILCVVLLFVALIPQLVDSASALVSNMDTYVSALQEVLRRFETGSNSYFGLDFGKLFSFGDSFLDKVNNMMTLENFKIFAGGSANVGRGVFDIVIAFILAVYFLLDKRRITGGIGRFMALVIKPESFKKATEFLDRCNDILIRYISVDVIDGLIVGIVNFLFMVIMRMPYAALISVIVGVTNLAPTFGPIVGAILGAFVLVLIDPWYALWFLIFTVVLQTLDGYIIKPKLFGGSLGVSALMILIAIILGGKLFGVGGILLAIPFAAIIDFTWKDFVIKKLEERQAKRYNN